MSSQQEPDYLLKRTSLVQQLEREGIRSSEVLQAIHDVPREAFVPANLHDLAYRNTALPIGLGQTISQPFIVALMAEALQLEPTDRVLEIGTGSGYAAAVLSKLAREVYSVERYPELAQEAERALRETGCDNVHVLRGDGTEGWPEFAPYDAISVTAGSPEIPPPLLNQLRRGGRLVMPLGEANDQELVCVSKLGDEKFTADRLVGVRFVPLISEEQEHPPESRDIENKDQQP